MPTTSTIRSLSTLGDRLKAERKRLGWSREKMAEFGGVSNASQRLYDSSDRIPSLIYLLNLAKEGADFNYLLHDERPESITQDYLKVSAASIDKAFHLACHMWQCENGRVSTVDDAAELFLSLLKQVHVADDPGVDLGIQELSTSEHVENDSQ